MREIKKPASKVCQWHTLLNCWTSWIVCQANFCVHNPTALARREGEDRVEVELADFWDFFNEARDPQQHIFDGFDVSRPMSPITREQAVAFDPTDHFGCVTIGEGCDAELHIAENLDVNAAQAEGDQGPEQRIVRDPHHHLHTTGYHRLHEDPFHRIQLVVLGKVCSDRLKSVVNRPLIPEIQLNTAALCFVYDLMRGQLNGHWVANLLGQGHRLICRTCDSAGLDR